MPLVLGVDSSIAATRVELRDADSGELVGAGHAPHPPAHPRRGEQDPVVWWQALLDARSQTASPLPTAVAVAAQAHGLIALDDHHRVIRPALLADNTVAAADAQWLVDKLGGAQAWADAVGTVPVAALPIAKLSWLHRKEPGSFAQMTRVVMPHDWLTGRIAGRFVTDRGDASGTGYWSPRERRYRTDVLAVVDRDRDWLACVPKVLGPLDPAGEREGVTIAAGTGDIMAAALGAALHPGDVMVSVGPTGAVATVSIEPVADASGAVAGLADATGLHLPAVGVLNATRATDAIARLLRVDEGGLDRLALAASPGAGGVVLVPNLDGGRTPDRPDATGSLVGLRSDVTPQQVARAAVEGVVCGILDGFDALAATGVPVDGRLVLVGSGARSHAYQRVLAGLSGRPVEVPRGDVAALGACIQASAVLTQRPPQEVADAWRVAKARVVEPDDVDAAAVRAQFTATRERERRADEGSS